MSVYPGSSFNNFVKKSQLIKKTFELKMVSILIDYAAVISSLVIV